MLYHFKNNNKCKVHLRLYLFDFHYTAIQDNYSLVSIKFIAAFEACTRVCIKMICIEKIVPASNHLIKKSIFQC